MQKYHLGIDIGGTFIKYALIDDHYRIFQKWKVKAVNMESSEQFYDYICSNIKHIEQIEKVGVSAPGLIDQISTVKSYAAPNVSIMYGTNINDEIGKRINRKVQSINDAKAAGLCEFTLGNAKGCQSSAFLIIGTGTGGCICDENGVIYGKDGYAAEFHNIPFFNQDSNQSLKRMGDYTSITGLLNLYNENSPVSDQLNLGSDVCKKYLGGNAIAQKSVQQWIQNITTQLIAITVFYNPEVICIGGGISEEDWFINMLQVKYKKMCQEYFELDFITTAIKRCKYNNDANILGAVIKARS